MITYIAESLLNMDTKINKTGFVKARAFALILLILSCSLALSSYRSLRREFNGTVFKKEKIDSSGADYASVVKTGCFLADMNDFAAFNEVYAKYFTEKPARSCVAVKTLPKNVLCEVEVIAYVG